MPELKKSSTLGSFGKNFALCLFIIGLLVGSQFSKALQADYTVFSNDGPLGFLMSDASTLPDVFSGFWQHLNWVGKPETSAVPNISWNLLYLLGPIWFSKLYAPSCLIILGISAWLYFRQAGFLPSVCILGGIAAALNSNVLSNVCWGLGSRALVFACGFLALAAVQSPTNRNRWISYALSGLAVGMAVMEGYDVGAIFSLYIAAYVIFISLRSQETGRKKWLLSISRTTVVALFAAYISAHALFALITTQLSGIRSAQTQGQTATEKWDWATMWSLPKAETLRVLVPGLYGYRMDTSNGGNYWGSVGQTPSVIQSRSSGAGEYAGILVALVALWAMVQSFRKREEIYDSEERAIIRFWMIAGFISLLFAFGRHAPFYQLVYSLPYFSSIRNPLKFMHPFHFSLMILFGYGLQGLLRKYATSAPNSRITKGIVVEFKSWWKNVKGYDRQWLNISLGLGSVFLLGWLLYASSKKELTGHLVKVLGLPPTESDKAAAQIADFSIGEVGWSVLFYVLAASVILLIMSGALAGTRRWLAITAVGVVLVFDLGRANQPWIMIYNFKQKYATNEIIDVLKENSYEHRVAAPSFRVPPQYEILMQMYQVEWMQHHFQYYNVQSIDIIQGETKGRVEYLSAFGNSPLRMWQLMNVRYLLLPTGFISSLNQKIDPTLQRFKNKLSFTFVQGPDNRIETIVNTNGPFSLVEFTGTLPRAKLYANWELAATNSDATVLAKLAAPDFNPERTVMVSEDTLKTSQVSTNTNPGNVSIQSYKPKKVILETTATEKCVLLLNDQFDPAWKVWVNGKQETTLRCNHIMKGVLLEPGKHTVEFRYEPPSGSLYITLSAMALGLFLCGFSIFQNRSTNKTDNVEGSVK